MSRQFTVPYDYGDEDLAKDSPTPTEVFKTGASPASFTIPGCVIDRLQIDLDRLNGPLEDTSRDLPHFVFKSATALLRNLSLEYGMSPHCYKRHGEHSIEALEYFAAEPPPPSEELSLSLYSDSFMGYRFEDSLLVCGPIQYSNVDVPRAYMRYLHQAFSGNWVSQKDLYDLFDREGKTSADFVTTLLNMNNGNPGRVAKLFPYTGEVNSLYYKLQKYLPNCDFFDPLWLTDIYPLLPDEIREECVEVTFSHQPKVLLEGYHIYTARRIRNIRERDMMGQIRKLSGFSCEKGSRTVVSSIRTAYVEVCEIQSRRGRKTFESKGVNRFSDLAFRSRLRNVQLEDQSTH